MVATCANPIVCRSLLKRLCPDTSVTRQLAPTPVVDDGAGQGAIILERGRLFEITAATTRISAVDILLQGAPGSPLVKLLSGRMMRRDYTPNFALQLMMKDLAYAGAEGARVGVKLATAEAARQVFQNAVDAGLGEEDMSAVVEPLRK